MTDAPAESANTIVGISFGDTFRAQEFLTATYRLTANKSIELLDAVTIVKDADGKTSVRETRDPQAGPSALSGGLWASLFGLILGGPVGWLAGAAIGAGVGAVSAKIVDIGVPDDWVRWFRDAVQPSTATVVLLLGRFDRGATLDELERFAGARLVYANVGPDVVQRIRDALDDPTAGPMVQEPDDPFLTPPEVLPEEPASVSDEPARLPEEPPRLPEDKVKP